MGFLGIGTLSTKLVWDSIFTRWWFQIFVVFTPPLFGEDSHFDYTIFSRWVETTNQFSSSLMKQEHLMFRIGQILWKVLVDTFIIVSRLSKMVKLSFDLHHSKVVSYRLSFRVVDKKMWLGGTGWGEFLTKVQSNFKEHVSWWNWWHFHPRQYHFLAPFAPLSTSPALSSGVALIWTLLCAWGSSFAPHLLLDFVTFDVSSV